MSRFRFITIEGVTLKTPINQLREAHTIYPGVEWSVRVTSFEKPGCVSLKELPAIARRLKKVADSLYLSLTVSKEVVDAFLDSARFNAMPDVKEAFSRIHLEIQETAENYQALDQFAARVHREAIQVITEDTCHQCSRERNREVLFNGVANPLLVSHMTQQFLRKVGFYVPCAPSEMASVITQLEENTRMNGWDSQVYWLNIGASAQNPQGELDFNKVSSYLHALKELQTPTIIGRKPVDKLRAIELDWWMGVIEGYNMVPLTKDSCSAVYLHRPTGKMCQTHVGTSWSEAGPMLKEHGMSVLEVEKGVWQGAYLDSETGELIRLVKSRNYLKAGLLSIVMRNRGKSVPIYAEVAY